VVGSLHEVKSEAFTFVSERNGTPLLLPAFDESCNGDRRSERFDQESMSFTVLDGLFPTDGEEFPCAPGTPGPAVNLFGTSAAMLSDGRALLVGGQDPNVFVPSARAFIYVPPQQ